MSVAIAGAPRTCPGALGMAAALEASLAAPLVTAEIQVALDALAQTVGDRGGVWLADRLACPSGFIKALAIAGDGAAARK